MDEVKYYQFNVEKTLKNLDSRKEGLTPLEVEDRLKLYGKNKLAAIDKESLILKFLSQFKDLMAIILIIAGLLSLYMHSYRDTIIMFSIVIINAIISFVQEYKAERVMDSLKSLVIAKAKVIRYGKEIEIDGESLVPGDIVVLEEGDAVPADIRIIEENTLSANDFSLTGESDPTRKFLHPIEGVTELGSRNNMAFMGTTIATGNGLGVVTSTGMQTELGRIANLSQQTVTELSPLQKEFNDLAKKISYMTLAVAAALFILGIFLHLSLRESFLFALGIAAACVPEGLPAQASVALSLAAGRLAQKKAVIKKLSAVETLGSTHIICTDKTGTLTTNEMTVQKFLIGQQTFDVEGIGYEPKGDINYENGKQISKEDIKKYRLFFENGVFASNAKVRQPDLNHTQWYAIGDPTEAALMTLAEKAGINSAKIDKENPELKEFTFDAVRKRMSSIRNRDGKIVIYSKGSPQALLERCTQYWDGEAVKPLTEECRSFIAKKNDEFAMLALRNLGYAYRELPRYDENMEIENTEKNLIWLGMVAMIDPPRKEVKEAIGLALKAFIRVIIITGDYALTAEAIAKKIGMNAGGKDKTITVVTGKELNSLSDIDLLHKLIYTNLIFARTSPEDKLRIVTLLKKAGEVVAVTGDGVNDAPALKKADIGVAMGKTGTQVAKDSSELILLDDSFGTLVTAIREGRTIYQNLKKTVTSSMTSNGGELFAVLLSLVGTAFFGYPLAILAVQILAVDLVGEIIPLTFLTWDPAQAKLMTSPPREPNEHIINAKILINITWCGFIMGLFAYANFIMVFFREGASLSNVATDSLIYMRATTLTYISIVFIQWMNILSRRAGDESVFTSYLWSNKRLFLGYGITLIILLLIVYNPIVSHMLYTAPLTMMDWLFAIAASVLYLFIREAYKVVVRKKVK
jgi:Ca2+-transporting ATPase